MIKRAVVVGGAGAVGRLFAGRLLASSAEVTVIDTAASCGVPGARYVRGDITAPGFRVGAEVGHADLVVLALPETAALSAVPEVARELRPDAVLVDTLSVKQPITRAVRDAAPGVQAVGLNPMFAPSLGFEGRPVAAVVVHEGPRTGEVLRLVEEWGARVVRVGAQEHDRIAAAVQALPHAVVLGFGLALRALDVSAADVAAVAPPPVNTLLALLARVTSGTPEVYWDVQAANPEAEAARSALDEGLRRLAEATGGSAEFAALLADARAALGSGLDHYRDTCARLFHHV
ncbi:prephenate dehydrogenase/arogenate dehydrogenase family protein [Streptomyces sp. NWU339]|uniref:prephenate dehydrogenase/arogenate dehydrogenase family protein n=1 Tax=Streptomyces sp. NWU339 TaxID=2185284 RepID=UPI000D67D466|nr:prephenate dehydrogenase/arogenate dehydrogenase family protein [Streptomyces sp. NWU339]PWI08954.1 prephenate dehydrogenase/arogenate dehydrogenase family protein [Streptomyces sp. NWU339]